MNWVLVEEEHNRGSGDPFVARTTMQAGDIVKLYQLGKEREIAAVGVYDTYRRHLHQCSDIAKRLITEIEQKENILKTHLEERKNGDVLRLPAAHNLSNDVETFLYHAKLGFRDIKDIFQHTLDKKFKATTQYKHVASWAAKRFGEGNVLTRFLEENCGWIQKVIDSRNAVEHPDSHTLEIQNFHTTKDARIFGPTWSLDGEDPKAIYPDMKVLPVNMLEFSELLLLYCLSNVKDISPIIIAEIPIEKRQQEAPKRFIATLAQDIDKNGFYKGYD